MAEADISSSRENFDERVLDVLAAALEKEPHERPQFVNEACGKDSQLRAEVDRLLQVNARLGDAFCKRPTLNVKALCDDRLVGQDVGSYRIVAVLGQGGMGTVYRAEQLRPIRRTVALKLIRLGMDTQSAIGRFETEREALALMNHPNVAKVFDAGVTETGRPYVVMEYVEGKVLTAYCDEQRQSIRDRLSLFIQVCHAIQHAHQNRVIHRDLKPGNVLVADVDGKPCIKVIDFGIAKATQKLTDDVLSTAGDAIVGTPAYMSPEQADFSSRDIDTRADVYALGVLLYELLVGKLPFDPVLSHAMPLAEVLRIIREVDPQKPSVRLGEENADSLKIAEQRNGTRATIVRQLRKDLDWIVMKCLDKDRERRYATANGLAEDIQRFLINEPVLAGPPSATYRLRKFVRRNKLPVTAVLTVVLALGIGLVVSEIQRRRALRAEALAATRLVDAEAARDEAFGARDESDQVTRFLSDMLGAVNPAKLGKDVTVREVLDTAADRIDEEFANRPFIESRLRHTIGLTYLALGLYEKAEGHLADAAAFCQRACGEKDRRTLAAMTSLASALQARGQYTAVEAQMRSALAIQRRALGEEHPDTLKSMSNLANSLYNQGRWAEAEELHRAVLQGYRRTVADEHPDTLRAKLNLVNSIHAQGRYAEADELRQATLQTQRSVLGEGHPETLRNMSNWAISLQDRGHHAEAQEVHEKVAQIRRRVLGEDHPETLRSTASLASNLANQGRYTEAEAIYLQILDTQTRVLGEEHPDTLRSLGNLAICLRDQGRDAEAEVKFLKMFAIQERVLGPEYPDTLASMYSLATTLRRQRRYHEAEALFHQTWVIRRRVWGEEHPSTLASMHSLANSLWDQGWYAEAEELHKERLGIERRVFGEEHPRTLLSIHNLANCIQAQGRYAEAEELHRRPLEVHLRVSGEEHPDTLLSMNDLANSLLAQGCYAEAEELYRIVLRTRRRVLGHEHPRTLDSTMALAQALRKQSSSYDAAFTPETNGEARDPDQPSESQSLCAEAIDGRRLRAESVNASAGDFASYAAAVLLCEAEGPRNSEAALAAALRAVELTGRSDADLLDTLAVAYHRTGQSGLAVESLREALALVPSNPSIFRADIESRLGAYLVAEGHFAEAEPLLIGNFTWIAETVQAAPHKVKEHADRLYELYEAWDVAEPGNGYAETAARWRKQTAGVQ